MTTAAALGAEISLSSVWLPLMLGIFALNGVTTLACVAFVLHKNDNNASMNTAPVATTYAAMPTQTPRITRQDAIAHEEHRNVCGKRKTREQPVEFPFARRQNVEVDEELTQGRCKQRRIIKTSLAYRMPRRSSSFGSSSSSSTMLSPPSPLRRVVSCGDAGPMRHFETQMNKPFEDPTTAFAHTPSEELAMTLTSLLREIRLRDVLSSAKAIIVAKLRVAARNAIDEVLTSIISFATYGLLLLVLRQYSAVAVGVSLDLGAFSIEL